MNKVEVNIGNRKLSIESGNLARQADGSTLVRYGDTIVLTTVTYKKEKKDTFQDFLPLIVDYRELAYAAGKIPGGFFKREGKPRDKEILVSRLIDRSIRPLFPKGFNQDVQVVSLLLSFDQENEGDLLGIIGASTSLLLSEIPFSQPVAAVRIGKINNKYVVNPTIKELELSTLDLVVSATKETPVMLEGDGKEVQPYEIIEAIEIAMEEIRKIIEAQERLAIDVNKLEVPEKLISEDFAKEVRELIEEKVIQAYQIVDKKERQENLRKILEETFNLLKDKYPNCESQIQYVIEEIAREYVRRLIIKERKRIDGRTPEEIRPLSCAVSVLPRTHGSALFTRGQTQCLVVVTLGTKSDELIIDDLEGEGTKRFMLHYNFPPFSTGEVKPLRAPTRREIGHGFLAERAFKYLLPSEEEFPYTIRVVSDILESNGSSSMATVCGATLSLMDAGVPLKKAVAGIAMGLVKEGENYVILTDITGTEDHYGDMDFKIAGTKDGITAIQLDLKIQGVPIKILEEAINKARIAHKEILELMAKSIDQPRKSISSFAPRVFAFQIPKDKIGAVIGTGGKVIRKIIDETNTEIFIEDDGKITISGPNEEAIEKAKSRIMAIVEDVEVGKVYLGEIKRIAPFGVFVEIAPGKEGLCHISQWANYRVKNLASEAKVGDKIFVRVIAIDEMGRIQLSKKAVGVIDDTKRKN
ncbi:MAG: polyribonucleotide nucleotidyltransferase [candidate division WOR-3 bacterium]|nr:polyribonucleotide nucleotidyltransferase [candidate division WOR-3 bacterium]MDW8113451.1 polyribonucleotide nucleotidyltransferase [candidate division WOR-3 bacterium]